MTSLEKLSYCYFGLSKSSDSVIFKEENSGGSLTQGHMANCVGFDLQPYSLLLRLCCHFESSLFHSSSHLFHSHEAGISFYESRLLICYWEQKPFLVFLRRFKSRGQWSTSAKYKSRSSFQRHLEQFLCDLNQFELYLESSAHV